MEERLMVPAGAHQLYKELENNDLLVDEHQADTSFLHLDGLSRLEQTHQALNRAIVEATGEAWNHLQYISIRVFQPGEYATTIHVNDRFVGPWVVGLTLAGAAPFSVYEDDVLKETDGQPLPLNGDGNDPVPLDTLNTAPGSAWALYTENWQGTHSGGLVEGDKERVLAVFFGTNY